MKNLLTALILLGLASCQKETVQERVSPMDLGVIHTDMVINMPVGYPFNTPLKTRIQHTDWEFHEEYVVEGQQEFLGHWNVEQDTFYYGSVKLFMDGDTIIEQFDSYENVPAWGIVRQVSKHY